MKKSKEQTEKNNKLRWFYVGDNNTLEKSWYEKTGTGLKNNKWEHTIKKRDTKLYFTITEQEFQNIKNQFKKNNSHLF